MPLDKVQFTAYATPAYARHIGLELLRIAEENRRESDNGFPTAPLPGESPDQDWAPAAQIVSAASRVLDEAVPNGQARRTESALGALMIGVEMLRAALARREVLPASLLVDRTDGPR